MSSFTWELLGGAEILVAPVPGHLFPLVVEHARSDPLIVGPAQFLNLHLPVAFLPQQFVDLVVEVAYAELTQAGVLNLGHLLRYLADDLHPPLFARVQALAFRCQVRPPFLVFFVLAELGRTPPGERGPGRRSETQSYHDDDKKRTKIIISS